MKTILFQGDSITDTWRNEGRGSLSEIGQGYAAMVAGELGVDFPGEYKFENRGISGNRSCDLYARIKEDVWNLKPDIISLLIGVNDCLHDLKHNTGVSPERFEKIYTMIIEDTLAELPDCKFILMEPFVLPGELTNELWGEAKKDVTQRGEIVKKLADKYGFTFVPLQNVFDDACEICPPDYWIGDGVHPTVAGHGLIKREWLKAFQKIRG